MPIVCGVRFRESSKIYYFSPGDVTDLQVGDRVIVETSRGQELGVIKMPPKEVDQSKIVGQLKPILRRATAIDLLDAQHFQAQEAQALEQCKELVNKSSLPMKVVGAEYSYDGTRLTFFFTSEQRVDFRDLVRELAHIFKTRIELRQIGVRDEAKMKGGLGKCGRMLCCATWLHEFCPVSIRMAKQQDLPLTPMEISGLCGRLLCCLEYENDYYQEVKGKFPKVGKAIMTPRGPGKVAKVSVLRETVTVLLEDGSTIELTADQVAGKAALEEQTGDHDADEMNDEMLRTLEASLQEEYSSLQPRLAIGREEKNHEKPREAARSSEARPTARREQKPWTAERPPVVAVESSSKPGTDKPTDGADGSKSSRRKKRRAKSAATQSDKGQVGTPSRKGGEPSEQAQSSEQPAKRVRRPRRRRGQQSQNPA